MTDDFTPRLGRIGDRGRAGQDRFAQRLRKAVARAAKPAGKPRFSGAGIGRGGASARALEMRPRRLPRFRMRRVIVKTHISKAPKGGGTGALKAHLGYIQRDSVERDGSGGELYARDGTEPDADRFLARCEGDRHQFRIIVSAEDGARLDDLKDTTRALMAQMESDLGTRLDWLAVDHHNTGHPHTHIVIRGKDANGKDLVIAPDYIRTGLARRASDLVTERLGPRRDLEIAQARQAEIGKDRFTGLDRAILADVSEGRVRIGDGEGPGARFEQSLRQARLRHLETLKLAVPMARESWAMKPGWDEALKAMGHRGDVLKALAARMRDHVPDHNLRWFEPGAHGKDRLTGAVLTSLPDDELRDRRSLVVEDFDGRRWMVDAGLREPGTTPPDGAVVEVGARPSKPREIDVSIARIAERSGGLYSEALHIEADPASTRAWRQGHVRRLEALRRAGITERGRDGVWQVPQRFADKAMTYDARHARNLEVQVRSWLPLQEQIRHSGLTWLDEEAAANAGERLTAAKTARLEFLRQKGWLENSAGEPDEVLRSRLRNLEMQRASAVLYSASGRYGVELSKGERFEGQFEKAIDLGQGRFAVIGNAKEFALVPWRPEIERHRGRDINVTRTARGINWSISTGRGLER